MTERIVNDLAEQARRVGRQQEDYDAAWDGERRAQAEVLDGVVTAMKPALRAICGKIPIKGKSSARGSGTEAATFKGVLVSAEPTGQGPRVVPIAGDRHRGRFAGTDLFLNDQGVLVELVYEGSWSNVEGEESHWEAKWCPMTSRHVITEYSVEKIIDRLTTVLLESAKGAAPMRTAMLLTRAETLRNVAGLLKAVK
jgi:hypothetical protein